MKKYLIAIFIILLSLFGSISTDIFSSYKINQIQKGVYLIEIDNFDNSFMPYYVDELEKNRKVYKKIKPRFIVNTGFFEMKQLKGDKTNSVSSVIINGKEYLSPEEAKTIRNRADFELLVKKGMYYRTQFVVFDIGNNKVKYDIFRRHSPFNPNYKIKHAMQGGPMLYPRYNPVEEYFLQMDDKGIVSKAYLYPLKKMARTAIAIRNNRVYLLLADKKPGLSYPDLINLIYQLDFEKALGYDGGYSTSFDSKTLHIDGAPFIRIRKLKSFLILK